MFDISILTMYRILENECRKFKVKLSKPNSVKSFLDALKIIKLEKRKAENVLIDEVENDIEQKEKFISEQVRTLSEMQTNMNTLIEHKNVISIAAQVISGAFEPGAEGIIANDEEAKAE